MGCGEKAEVRDFAARMHAVAAVATERWLAAEGKYPERSGEIPEVWAETLHGHAGWIA